MPWRSDQRDAKVSELKLNLINGNKSEPNEEKKYSITKTKEEVEQMFNNKVDKQSNFWKNKSYEE